MSLAPGRQAGHAEIAEWRLMPLSPVAPTGPSAPDPSAVVRSSAIELLALAQSGLHYANDQFDRQRYAQARSVGLRLMELVSVADLGKLERSVALEQGHATPKVDVRGAIFHDGKVLLVQERSDQLWTLPGGWCDVLESPREAVAREIKEESGLTVEVVELAAVLDRERQAQLPAFPFHVYKMFFLCRILEVGTPDELETLDVGWFAPDDLPPLSTGRVTKTQLQMMVDRHLHPGRPAAFD